MTQHFHPGTNFAFVPPEETDQLPQAEPAPAPEVGIDVVLHRVPGTIATSIGAETVVYRAADSFSWVMNSVAALVWECIDGESTLDEILADVADVFGESTARVRDDFMPVVERWLNDGLVADAADAAVAFPGFTITDADGHEWRWLMSPPNDCGQALRNGWSHSAVLGLGHNIVTVGSEDAEFIASLEPWAIDINTAMVDYGLDVIDGPPPPPGTPRFLPALKHGSCSQFRLRDKDELRTIMRRILASFTPVESPDQFRIEMMPILDGERALLLPASHGGQISHRLYERNGLTPLYTRSSVIDVVRWTVRVDPPLGADDDAASRWYPIVDWWLPSNDPTHDISPGESLAHVLRLAGAVDVSDPGASVAAARQAVEDHPPGLALQAPDRILEELDPALSSEMREELLAAILGRFAQA